MSIRPELRRELMALSAEERHELADELYASLADANVDPAWQTAWSGAVSRRLADVAEGRVSLIDADEVHSELHAELADPQRR